MDWQRNYWMGLDKPMNCPRLPNELVYINYWIGVDKPMDWSR